MGNCLTISDREEEENGNNNGEAAAATATAGRTRTIKGSVVVVKKGILDIHDIGASIIDRIYELFGKRVSLQLISIPDHDHDTDPGKVGKPAILENWVTSYITTGKTKNREFEVNFDWEEDNGIPGALIIKNNHHSQFFLKSITLHDVPGHNGVPIHFICNSWVYPARRYNYDRIFFPNNKTCLPNDTPPALKDYRKQELVNLRGDGKGKLQEWDRVYDYAYYNDLGIPGKSGSGVRPILGGSQEYPYPRRVRTGRNPTKADPNTESRLPMLSLSIYIPSDERFSNIKMSDFLAYAAKSIAQVTRQEIKAVFDKTINEFDTFHDILDIYSKKKQDPNSVSEVSNDKILCQILKELTRSDGEHFSTFPWPAVVKGEDKSAWRTDEEFGREMVAGVNPVCIRRLLEFPPVSNLDREVYGNQNSSMSRDEIESRVKGLIIDDAIEKNKLFILDHHDALMPYLRKINEHPTTKIYASRTLLLLRDDDTLIPLAIELSLPDKEDKQGAISRVYTPPKDGDDPIKGNIWHLAKAYAAVNDSGYHQLICHWLNTHAVIEPFVIATNRQLSILHPIYQLLQPHYKDTVQINALARHILISADGVLELTVFPGKYSMEMSSVIYKNWNLMEQGLPADLIKRGMAVEDSTQPRGLRLLIKDYPYAVDGLEIWFAIEEYVNAYCEFYYPTDELVASDSEIQSWFEELRTEGHGDLKDKNWWPKMKTRKELVDICTIVIWVATALHAAVNFGQYPYAGYLPNRPTVSRKFMPEPGTDEYKELEENPDLAFLKTITAQFQTLLGVSLIEMLSRHSSDEVYLGQRDVTGWTEDSHPLNAFKEFGKKLIEIEKRIDDRNNDPELKNRNGPVMVPYTLLYPGLSDPSKAKGLTGIGVPNSVSI